MYWCVCCTEVSKWYEIACIFHQTQGQHIQWTISSLGWLCLDLELTPRQIYDVIWNPRIGWQFPTFRDWVRVPKYCDNQHKVVRKSTLIFTKYQRLMLIGQYWSRYSYSKINNTKCMDFRIFVQTTKNFLVKFWVNPTVKLVYPKVSKIAKFGCEML
jgi:hypothetical protein